MVDVTTLRHAYERPREEGELRRLIDRAMGRAACDRGFEAALLADPTLALGGFGCTPQQYLDLRSIRARTLKEFSQQATALFWPGYRPAAPLSEMLPLAVS